MNSNTCIKKYFRVFIPESQYAKPIAPIGIDHTVFRLTGKVDNWEPFTYKIQKNGGIVSDYLSSTIGARLCSEKLRAVIDKYKNAKDHIQWLPVTINCLDSGETLTYYHLHFLAPFSGHSRKYSMYSPTGRIMNPVWLYKDVKDMELFTCSEIYQYNMIILSEDLLKKIEAVGCTGLSLEPASVIYDECQANNS